MKKALITGGSTGLGASFVSHLNEEGYQVFATSRNASGILNPIKGVVYLDLELGDSGKIKSWVSNFKDKFGTPDLLINNAGYGAYFQIIDFPKQEIEIQLSVMLQSPIFLCKYFASSMALKEGACIVNVSSLAAQFPLPYMSVYNSAKAGLGAFSRSLMLEYSDQELQIIDFRPGDFKTRFNKVLNKSLDSNEKLDRVWCLLEKHLDQSPDVSLASRDLLKAIRLGRSGIFYSGDFFQAKLGPLFYKLAPEALIQWFLRLYYKI